MKTTIESPQIEVEVESKGAELSKLVLKKNGIDYLWNADPAYWSRHAPVLFPIVGRLKGDAYTYEGKSFRLTQHGFGRDREFRLVSRGKDRLVYRLESDEATKAMYPFDFAFDIGYRAEGNALAVEYVVKNTGRGALYFSVGAHPAFACPIGSGETMEDYDLVFNQKENLERSSLDDGLVRREKTPFLTDGTTVKVTRELFANGAIVLEGFRSTSLALRSRKSGRSVTVEFPGFPFLGIWSKPEGAPFVCIEPWYGVGDPVDSDGDYAAKKGIQRLAPGATFRAEYRVVIA